MSILEFMKHAKWFLLLMISMFIIIVVMLTAANAHEWYDPDCCDERDCVPVEKIVKIGNYQMWYTKTFDPIKIKNSEFNGDFFSIRASQDARYHICATEWLDSDQLFTRIRCVYIPGTS